MSAECAFCCQPLEDPAAEFCPGVGCSGSYRLLLGKVEDVVPTDEEAYAELDDALVLPLR